MLLVVVVSPFPPEGIDGRSGTPLRSDLFRRFTGVLTLSTVLSFAVNAAKKSTWRKSEGREEAARRAGEFRIVQKGERTRWDYGGESAAKFSSSNVHLWSDATGNVDSLEGESERPHCSPRNKRIGRGPTIIRHLLDRPAYKRTVRDTRNEARGERTWTPGRE